MTIDPNFWEDERIAYREAVADIIMPILMAGNLSGLSLLGGGVDQLYNYDIFNQQAIAWLQAYNLDTIDGISVTTRNRATQIIQDWVNEGIHLDVLKARLEPLFGDTRASTIATTEVTRIYAEGNLLAWEATQVVGWKVWQTARDERVCPQCGPLHGTRVPLRGSWLSADVVTGGGIVFTSVSTPPRHPNCRCWLKPEVDLSLYDQVLDRILAQN
jgi:hypothetical protein